MISCWFLLGVRRGLMHRSLFVVVVDWIDGVLVVCVFAKIDVGRKSRQQVNFEP